MGDGGSIVTLTFDNRVAWPAYDWMGVCKAGLESVVRYLARDLGPRGIRVNTVAAGPLSTVAAKAIPGLEMVLLTVAVDQPAPRKLYQSLGFRSIGVEPKGIKIGTEHHHEEHMVLEFR